MTTSEVTNQSRPPSAGDAAHSMAETAREEGKAVVDTAKQETSRLASSARSEMRKQGDEQTRRLAERVRDVADELGGVRRGEAPTGTVATVLSEVETRAQFARQRPGLFLLGAFGLGIVAGRTLRNADTRALAEAAKPSDDGPDAPGSYGNAASYGSQTTLDPSTNPLGATPTVSAR